MESHLLFSRKGKMVMSPEYQEIRRQTPHIKYKTAQVVLFLLILLLILIVGSIVAFLMLPLILSWMPAGR